MKSRTINGRPMAVGDTVCRATDRDRYGTVKRFHDATNGTDWVVVEWQPINGGHPMVEYCQPFALDYDRRGGGR